MKPAALLGKLLSMLVLGTPAVGMDRAQGTFSHFQSYHGVEETCVRVAPIPGGKYSIGDISDEMRLCDLDFYSPEVALCPKIWSTSAAVVLYDISSGRLAGQRTKFQEIICAEGKIAEYVANDDLARLLITMNQSTTSTSTSGAALLYYHLSRYFDMTTRVPVAVWRNIDKQVLRGEVANTGAILTEGNEELRQNHAAWTTLIEAIDDPSSYARPGSFGGPEDLFTKDGDKVYGALLDATDLPYGPVMSGTQELWRSDSVRYFGLQKTPAFVALASDAPLEEAIAIGLRDGVGDLRTEFDGEIEITPQQMAFWMREMSEILLLDAILGQQDRPGNIDYKLYYYWLDAGKVERIKARDHSPGDGTVPETAVPIFRSRLNDNNSGGRPEYDNLTMQHRLLERLRHFDAGVYRRLMRLNADLQTRGKAYSWLYESLGADRYVVEMVERNTARAAELLLFSCLNGDLRFDLNPKRFFRTGDVAPDVQPCFIEE